MKVGIIGSAPSSILLAPYGDPSWQIWCCSPGAYGVAQRTDVYYELHRWQPPTPGRPGTGDPWFSPEYCQFLRQHQKVTVADPAALGDIPNARMLPWQSLVEKYSPYFFASSISWMIAEAIEAGATEIGLWGVDMAATEEWVYQRSSCQYFVLLARALGITVHVPPESDLMVPPALYGVSECDHEWIKLTARKKELTSRMQMIAQQDTATKSEYHFVAGALDDLTYQMQTWAGFREQWQPKRLFGPKPE